MGSQEGERETEERVVLPRLTMSQYAVGAVLLSLFLDTSTYQSNTPISTQLVFSSPFSSLESRHELHNIGELTSNHSDLNPLHEVAIQVILLPDKILLIMPTLL